MCDNGVFYIAKLSLVASSSSLVFLIQFSWAKTLSFAAKEEEGRLGS
jgi:hypothetical protein